jgi:uncharacterized protein (DUF433 family)
MLRQAREVVLLRGHLAGKPDLDELSAAYPNLVIEDVQAALAYAYDALGAQRLQDRKNSPDNLPF